MGTVQGLRDASGKDTRGRCEAEAASPSSAGALRARSAPLRGAYDGGSQAPESKQAPCLKPARTSKGVPPPSTSRANHECGHTWLSLPPSPNRANRECGHTWVSLTPSPNRANRECGHSFFVYFSTFFRISHCMVAFLFLERHWLEVVTVKKTIPRQLKVKSRVLL